MARTVDKFDNFKKAVKRLNEANVLYKSNMDDDIYQDALIKRFEFTFELAWKTLREFMLDQGYQFKIASPKGVLSYAYQESIITDEQLWLEMLEDRNLSTHDYGREISQSIAERISTRYAKEMQALSKYIANAI